MVFPLPASTCSSVVEKEASASVQDAGISFCRDGILLLNSFARAPHRLARGRFASCLLECLRMESWAEWLQRFRSCGCSNFVVAVARGQSGHTRDCQVGYTLGRYRIQSQGRVVWLWWCGVVGRWSSWSSSVAVGRRRSSVVVVVLVVVRRQASLCLERAFPCCEVRLLVHGDVS
jgi:hypothetical protein